MKILIVEDDLTIRENIAVILKHAGYAVDLADKYAEALQKSRDNNYDLIILDWMLPDGTGIDLCHTIRQEEYRESILILTAKSQIEDLVKGLDAGADDYLTKPFVMPELLARIRSLLRRKNRPLSSSLLTVGDLILDRNKGTVTRKNRRIILRPKEFGLLEFLMLHADFPVSRDELFEHVWGENQTGYSNTVDVHIKYLRSKIDDQYHQKLIITVVGKGYKICAGSV